ncbi:hypothetical protein SeMB42_g01627 [Synchytrium endobioticum]|uniref:Coiled-coil SMC6 And NSE5 INteracting (CANIN) domain-containing protein n=1 Tax=Synchytrium endobioticum TaxID=286115 RepID=A0A507CLJ2_9FUNG|nr:hypothetical protein SeLEV6574_g07442 [Synchytrium endobioticum]TPX52152.1 hypothetical protein SeMB42_g01627 [Synchytrium endobioticum]
MPPKTPVSPKKNGPSGVPRITSFFDRVPPTKRTPPIDSVVPITDHEHKPEPGQHDNHAATESGPDLTVLREQKPKGLMPVDNISTKSDEVHLDNMMDLDFECPGAVSTPGDLPTPKRRKKTSARLTTERKHPVPDGAEIQRSSSSPLTDSELLPWEKSDDEPVSPSTVIETTTISRASRSARNKRVNYKEPPDRPEDDAINITSPSNTSKVSETLEMLKASYAQTMRRIEQYDRIKEWVRPNPTDGLDADVLKGTFGEKLEVDGLVKAIKETEHYASQNNCSERKSIRLFISPRIIPDVELNLTNLPGPLSFDLKAYANDPHRKRTLVTSGILRNVARAWKVLPVELADWLFDLVCYDTEPILVDSAYEILLFTISSDSGFSSKWYLDHNRFKSILHTYGCSKSLLDNSWTINADAYVVESSAETQDGRPRSQNLHLVVQLMTEVMLKELIALPKDTILDFITLLTVLLLDNSITNLAVGICRCLVRIIHNLCKDKWHECRNEYGKRLIHFVGNNGPLMQLELLQVMCVESTRLNGLRRSLAYHWAVGDIVVGENGQVNVDPTIEFDGSRQVSYATIAKAINSRKYLHAAESTDYKLMSRQVQVLGYAVGREEHVKKRKVAAMDLDRALRTGRARIRSAGITHVNRGQARADMGGLADLMQAHLKTKAKLQKTIEESMFSRRRTQSSSLSSAITSSSPTEED